MRDKQGSLYESTNFQANEAGNGLPKVSPVKPSLFGRLKSAGWLVGGLLFAWMILGEVLIPDNSLLADYRYSSISGRREGRQNSAQIKAEIKAINERTAKTAKTQAEATALQAVEQLKETMRLEAERQKIIIQETAREEAKKQALIIQESIPEQVKQSLALAKPEIQKQGVIMCMQTQMNIASQMQLACMQKENNFDSCKYRFQAAYEEMKKVCNESEEKLNKSIFQQEIGE